MEPPENIPESGGIFTFGNSKLTGNTASCFWLKNDVIVSASCGDEHTALITQKAKVYVFGSNNWGQLGLGHTNPSKKPACVKALKLHKSAMVACGRTHTLICTSNNKVFAFGNNSDSQLGIDSVSNSDISVEVKFGDIGQIKQIAAGADFSVVLTEDGDVYTWGSNAEGQLGLGNDVNEVVTPTMITGIEQIDHVACGYYHTALVSRSGNLYTFGEDEFCKLGERESADTSIPSRLILPESVKASKVACGGSHTAFISKSGDLYTLGGGGHGELGHGTTTLQISEPKLVDRLKGHNVCHISCGENFTSAVTEKGRLYTFGDGRHGKLALDDENYVNQFKPFRCKQFDKYNVKFAVCGGCHMIVSACSRNEEINDTDSEIEDPMQSYVDGHFNNGDSQLLNKKVNGHLSKLAVSPKAAPDLSRSLSAREKRRHGRENTLSRTLPPLRTMKANELAEMAKSLPKPVGQHESISNDWLAHPESVKTNRHADEVSEISAFNKVHKLVNVGTIDTLMPVKNNLEIKEEEDDEEEEEDGEEEEDEVESVKSVTLVKDISRDSAMQDPGNSGTVKSQEDKATEKETKTTKAGPVEEEKIEKESEKKPKKVSGKKDHKEKKAEQGDNDLHNPKVEDKGDDATSTGSKIENSEPTPETQDDKTKENAEATTPPKTDQDSRKKKGTKKSKLCNIL